MEDLGGFRCFWRSATSSRTPLSGNVAALSTPWNDWIAPGIQRIGIQSAHQKRSKQNGTVLCMMEKPSEKSMPNDLQKLIDAARLREFSPAEREEQRRSFAYGNTKIENSRITRERLTGRQKFSAPNAHRIERRHPNTS